MSSFMIFSRQSVRTTASRSSCKFCLAPSSSLAAIMTHNNNVRLFASGIDTVAENQMKAWLRKGGQDELKNNKGKKLDGDRHHRVANALGVGHDYLHSKILADNNIKPESIERRLLLDKGWKELQQRIQETYSDKNFRDKLSKEEFATSKIAKELFESSIQELDRQAKRVNDAIVSDSMLFNGRSPVPHSRRFRLQERIIEALEETEN